jgi:hypothetical protein
MMESLDVTRSIAIADDAHGTHARTVMSKHRRRAKAADGLPARRLAEARW